MGTLNSKPQTFSRIGSPNLSAILDSDTGFVISCLDRFKPKL